MRFRPLATLLIAQCVLLSSGELRAAQFDLSTATIADINAAFDAGALTSEKLVQLYLARIKAYDQHGPALNTVITLNAKALEHARALDAERKAKGPRSPMHGIPVMAKDVFDTFDSRPRSKVKPSPTEFDFLLAETTLQADTCAQRTIHIERLPIAADLGRTREWPLPSSRRSVC
jgi:hypothetical protein